MRTLQRSDPSLTKFWELAEGKRAGDKAYPDLFFIKNDFLYRRNYSSKGLNEAGHSQLVVPKQLIELVLKVNHESTLGAHLASKKTIDKISSCFGSPTSRQ